MRKPALFLCKFLYEFALVRVFAPVRKWDFVLRWGAVQFCVAVSVGATAAPVLAAITQFETELLWRRCIGQEGEELVGALAGAVYVDGILGLLDAQNRGIHFYSGEVKVPVFVPFGGEGPGELADPIGVFGRSLKAIGVFQMFPPKVVLYDAEKHDARTVALGSKQFVLTKVDIGSSYLFWSGREEGFDGVTKTVTHFIESMALDGGVVTRIVESVYSVDPERLAYIEEERSFPRRTWLATDSDEVFIVTDDRDPDLLVYGGDGTLFGRYSLGIRGKLRSAEELNALRDDLKTSTYRGRKYDKVQLREWKSPVSYLVNWDAKHIGICIEREEGEPYEVLVCDPRLGRSTVIQRIRIGMPETGRMQIMSSAAILCVCREGCDRLSGCEEHVEIRGIVPINIRLEK